MGYKIRRKKTLKILGIFFLFADFFVVIPNFLVQTYVPWSLSLTTSQYRKVFSLKNSIGGGSNLYLS